MKGLVAYHTKYDNCRKIAEKIAQGLEQAGHEVTLVDSDASNVSTDFDFLAAGAGTRAGRMTGSMKRFLKREIAEDAWAGRPFLAFGTGMKPKGSGGGGAEGAVRIGEALEEKGLKPVSEAAKFWVSGIKGPLAEGEEERALELGREVGGRLNA